MREYHVTLSNGFETTMRLDDDEAKRLNAKPVETKQAEEPKAKQAAAPKNKAMQPKGDK